VSFHSTQADWHALQPMHFDASISLATLVSCRSGAGTLAMAETRTTSPGRRFEAIGWTGGLATAVTGWGALSLVMPSPPLRPARC